MSSSKKRITKTNNANDKLEELRLHVNSWLHHDGVYWNRFSIFIGILAIGATGLVFIYNNQLNIPSWMMGVFSFILTLLSFVCFLLCARQHSFGLYYIEKIKKIQKELNVLEHEIELIVRIKEEVIFPRIVRIDYFILSNTIFYIFIGGFLIVGFYFIISEIMSVHILLIVGIFSGIILGLYIPWLIMSYKWKVELKEPLG